MSTKRLLNLTQLLKATSSITESSQHRPGSVCPLIEEYTIGCICALQEEYDAVFWMLDEEFENPGTSQLRDPNTYGFGRIGEHLVAVACLSPSGQYGTYVYAQAARDMDRSFPNLWFILSVGIGGGAPTSARDIRLGDVVVSVPNNERCGLISYGIFSSERDPSTQLETDDDQYTHPQELLAMIPELQRLQDDPMEADTIAEHIRWMDNMPGFRRPDTDRLYRVDYEHRGGRSCQFCTDDGLVERNERSDSREISIHYGTIASGNTVVKDPFLRDKWANTPELNVLCFEMEASGVMPNFPSLAIRGICDYSDDHKNDEWHNYAALTAAAYTRALLLILKPRVIGAVSSQVNHEPKRFHGFLASLNACLRIILRRIRGSLKRFVLSHRFNFFPVGYFSSLLFA